MDAQIRFSLNLEEDQQGEEDDDDDGRERNNNHSNSNNNNNKTNNVPRPSPAATSSVRSDLSDVRRDLRQLKSDLSETRMGIDKDKKPLMDMMNRLESISGPKDNTSNGSDGFAKKTASTR